MTYPNRKHENADRRALANARSALNIMQRQIDVLRRGLEGTGRIYREDSQPLARQVSILHEQFTILETLRDVREWHAADEAEKPAEDEYYAGYSRGLDQGHHDAYMDNMSPCPECGMPQPPFLHNDRCNLVRRG